MNCVFCCINKAEFKCRSNLNAAFCRKDFEEHIKLCRICIENKKFIGVKAEVDKRLKVLKDIKISILNVMKSLIKQLEDRALEAISKVDEKIRNYKILLGSWNLDKNMEEIEKLFSTILVKSKKQKPCIQENDYFSDDFFIFKEKATKELTLDQSLVYLSENFNIEVEGHSEIVNSIVMTKDSRTIYSGSTDMTIKIWDTQSRNLKSTMRGHQNGITSLALSEKTNRLVSGSADKSVKIWCTIERCSIRTLREHSHIILCLAINSSETYLISGSADSQIIIWDFNKYLIISKLKEHSNWILSLSIHPNNSILATGCKDSSIKIWSLDFLTSIKTLDYHKDQVYSVIFSESPSKLISASKNDKKLIIWSSEDYSILREFCIINNGLNSLSINRENLIVCSEVGHIKIWNLELLEVKASFNIKKSKVKSICLSNDGNFIVVGMLNGKVAKVQVQNENIEELVDVVEMNQHFGKVSEIKIFNDHQMVGSYASDGLLKIWDFYNGSLIRSCENYPQVLDAVREYEELEGFSKYFS